MPRDYNEGTSIIPSRCERPQNSRAWGADREHRRLRVRDLGLTHWGEAKSREHAVRPYDEQLAAPAYLLHRGMRQTEVAKIYGLSQAAANRLRDVAPVGCDSLEQYRDRYRKPTVRRRERMQFLCDVLGYTFEAARYREGGNSGDVDAMRAQLEGHALPFCHSVPRDIARATLVAILADVLNYDGTIREHVELALQALDDDPATHAEIETYQAAADKRREYARTRAVEWRAKKKAQTKEEEPTS